LDLPLFRSKTIFGKRESSGIGYIEEFVVDEKHRGQGIGIRLFEHLVAEAREKGCRRIELDSAFHRKEAHGFYGRFGFKSRAFLFSKEL
jgi:GNAT superfamily N-acetyltransferase